MSTNHKLLIEEIKLLDFGELLVELLNDSLPDDVRRFEGMDFPRGRWSFSPAYALLHGLARVSRQHGLATPREEAGTPKKGKIRQKEAETISQFDAFAPSARHGLILPSRKLEAALALSAKLRKVEGLTDKLIDKLEKLFPVVTPKEGNKGNKGRGRGKASESPIPAELEELNRKLAPCQLHDQSEGIRESTETGEEAGRDLDLGRRKRPTAEELTGAQARIRKLLEASEVKKALSIRPEGCAKLLFSNVIPPALEDIVPPFDVPPFDAQIFRKQDSPKTCGWPIVPALRGLLYGAARNPQPDHAAMPPYVRALLDTADAMKKAGSKAAAAKILSKPDASIAGIVEALLPYTKNSCCSAEEVLTRCAIHLWERSIARTLVATYMGACPEGAITDCSLALSKLPKDKKCPAWKGLGRLLNPYSASSRWFRDFWQGLGLEDKPWVPRFVYWSAAERAVFGINGLMGEAHTDDIAVFLHAIYRFVEESYPPTDHALPSQEYRSYETAKMDFLAIRSAIRALRDAAASSQTRRKERSEKALARTLEKALSTLTSDFPSFLSIVGRNLKDRLLRSITCEAAKDPAAAETDDYDGPVPSLPFGELTPHKLNMALCAEGKLTLIRKAMWAAARDNLERERADALFDTLAVDSGSAEQSGGFLRVARAILIWDLLALSALAQMPPLHRRAMSNMRLVRCSTKEAACFRLVLRRLESGNEKGVCPEHRVSHSPLRKQSSSKGPKKKKTRRDVIAGLYRELFAGKNPEDNENPDNWESFRKESGISKTLCGRMDERITNLALKSNPSRYPASFADALKALPKNLVEKLRLN